MCFELYLTETRIKGKIKNRSSRLYEHYSILERNLPLSSCSLGTALLLLSLNRASKCKAERREQEETLARVVVHLNSFVHIAGQDSEERERPAKRPHGQFSYV
jgi:hypothetical protein